MDQTKIKTLSLICPSCGGRMELSADEEKAVCPYCGHEMLIDNDDDAQKEYERRMAKARADEDIKDLQRKRQRGRRLKGWLIAICVIAVLNLVTVFIPDSPMRNLIFPKTADPFTALLEIPHNYFYACGSETMMREICAADSSDGQIAFDKRLGCGFGACMGCSIRTTAGMKRFCKDGPVFRKGELVWDG